MSDDPGGTARPRTSTRDPDDLRRRLEAWLGRELAGAEVRELHAPSTNGMSSETLLFDARWNEGGTPRARSLAARLSPDASAMPVFPVYDLQRQFRVMRLVAAHSGVPVPATLWYEPDGAWLGAPFFVMERVEGDVPPDIMPYTFGSWLSEAAPADQARLQQRSVAVLAELHTMDVAPADVEFLQFDRPGETALRRHVADQAAYYGWVTADGLRMPLLERAFAWLDERWPDDGGGAPISWGDARVGNILYRDFEPVAVLDWEMAAVAPPEVDLGWMIYLHRFFQDLTEQAGMPGMPGFLRVADVATTYESLTGHTPRDLDRYILYAALRHGIVMSRVARRAVHFGEAEVPDDPDDFVMHRATIEAMLDGSYWSKVF